MVVTRAVHRPVAVHRPEVDRALVLADRNRHRKQELVHKIAEADRMLELAVHMPVAVHMLVAVVVRNPVVPHIR